MTSNQPASAHTDPPAKPPRFRWAMRLFLCILLFDIIFRSLSVMVPWADWARELEIPTLPLRLDTAEERIRLAAMASPENPDPVRKGLFKSLRSVRDFLIPWPEPETRQRMTTWMDTGKFTFVWLSSRFDFVENLIGFNQEWPMFSPNVGRRKVLTRARLLYADGSVRIQRIHADPADLNAYAHWNEEKVLDYELKVGPDCSDECFGYCNMLSHRHARNANDSPLVRIRLFEIEYLLAPPGVDYRQWYREQMRLAPDDLPGDGSKGPDPETTWQTFKDYYEFDVASRAGHALLND